MGLLANLIFINGPISITDEESYDNASDGCVEWFDSPKNMLPVFWQILLTEAEYTLVNFDGDFECPYLTIDKQKAVENLQARVEFICDGGPNWVEATYLLFVNLVSSINAETVFVRGSLINEIYLSNPEPRFSTLSDEQLSASLTSYSGNPYAGNCLFGDTWSYRP